MGVGVDVKDIMRWLLVGVYDRDRKIIKYRQPNQIAQIIQQTIAQLHAYIIK